MSAGREVSSVTYVEDTDPVPTHSLKEPSCPFQRTRVDVAEFLREVCILCVSAPFISKRRSFLGWKPDEAVSHAAGLTHSKCVLESARACAA